MKPEEFLEKPPDKVALYPDPVLTTCAKEITDLERWKRIAPIMFDLMHKHNGCGLAAPQVGLSFSMFVLQVTKPLVVINPVIVEVGERMWEEWEGCLSIPGKKFKIMRPRKIKARWIDLDGKGQCATFEGWTSRAFQHEENHLRGILINAAEERQRLSGDVEAEKSAQMVKNGLTSISG